MGRTLVEPRSYQAFRRVLKSEGRSAALCYLEKLSLDGAEWARWIEFSNQHSRSMTARVFLDYLNEPLTLSDARAFLSGQPSHADRLRAHGLGISL